MLNDPGKPAKSPLTPCIGICQLDEHGYCVGCKRTGAEIGRWSEMSDAQRFYVMREILPTRNGEDLP